MGEAVRLERDGALAVLTFDEAARAFAHRLAEGPTRLRGPLRGLLHHGFRRHEPS